MVLLIYLAATVARTGGGANATSVVEEEELVAGLLEDCRRDLAGQERNQR